MQVKVYEVYNDQTKVFNGSSGEILMKLVFNFPWLYKYRTLDEAIHAMDRLQSFSVHVVDADMLKSESHVSSHVIDDMHGFRPENEPAFKAARFLSGLPPVNRSAARNALYEEGDIERAALKAYGISITKENLKALQAFLEVSKLDKAESMDLSTVKIPTVQAVTQDGKDTAEKIKKAYKAGLVLPVQLAGKHSSGSMLARDDEDGRSYLLKPGTDTQSPAAGVQQEDASQSAREAAFWYVANNWNLGQWFPRADLLSLDGKLFACQDLLPFNFSTVERKSKVDKGLPQRLFRIPLSTGDLHKWAVLDAVLGNPDRHGQNCMVNQDGIIKLIDHGSAFAGPDFDPARDKNSFVPYYLRAWAPATYNQLTPEEKLKFLPRVNHKVESLIRDWLFSLDENVLKQIMGKYGIDPGPSVARLDKIRKMAETMPVDEAINKYWVIT